MITTVTTTTTTVLTSAAATSLTLVVILTMLALLIKKEISSGLSAPWARWLSRAINVAIVPLGVVFVTTVALRLAEFLR